MVSMNEKHACIEEAPKVYHKTGQLLVDSKVKHICHSLSKQTNYRRILDSLFDGQGAIFW